MDVPRRIAGALAASGVGTGQRIGVAVSGGADSMALLGILCELRTDVDVLHVDHAMREDSATDAAFVADRADELGLRCHVMRAPVRPPRRASPEAEARRIRYEALAACAEREGLPWVVTAHTLDDHAETVLMRVLRGAGTDGLGGIAEVRGIFVRPALGVRRAELRDWLANRGLGWREDPTNADRRFERNWIRHEVMPLLRARRAGVDETLVRLARHARADAEALDDLADEVFACAEIDDLGVLIRGDLGPRAVASRVIRKALWQMGVEATASLVETALSLTDSERRSAGGVVMHRLPDGLAIAAEDVPEPDPVVLEPGDAVLPSWGLRVRVGSSEEPPLRWRASIPSDEVPILRSRQPGDRVTTGAGSRKVADVLIDRKIPSLVRGRIPVLATEHGALAVVGLTSTPCVPGPVVDAEPLPSTWSREVLWSRVAS